MKYATLFFLFLTSQIVNCQSLWRPLGADDFNKPSYGNTYYSVSGYNRGGFKLAVKNDHVYSMNIEMNRNTNSDSPDWLVLGKYVSGRWQHVETPFWGNQHYITTQYAFALDNNETPYLFLNDPINGNKATVKKFDGTSWVTVGTGAVSTTYSYPIMEMAIGSDNLPFILYTEGGTIKTKKFNGTDWIDLPNTALQGLTNAIVRIDSNNIPYILYTYTQSNSNKYSMLRKYNGTNWEEVGITDFSGTAAGLCLDSTNKPYIAVDDKIRKFNGTSWETILYDPNATYYGRKTYETLALDSNDNLYLTYRLMSFDYYVAKLVNGSLQIMGNYYCPTISIAADGNMIYEEHNDTSSLLPLIQKRVGSSWEMLGDQTQIGTSGAYSMTASHNTPIVAFKNSSSKLSVKEFVSGTWSFVGNSTLSEQNISNAKIETDTNGISYIAYTNLISSSSTETQSHITVKKRVGNNWELVGPLNFSLSSEAYMDFKLNHQNVPYVVYKSGRVQKFNGSSWEFVGGSIYSGDKNVRLAFDNNDVPYILFSNSGPKVARYDGTGWEEVGTSSLSTFTTAGYPQIVCDSNNNIFIGFVGAYKSVNVLKWNGTTWEPVGSQTITTENFLKLTLDSNNTPVVAYSKNYNNFRYMLNVSKFNGSNWEILGNPDFSASGVTNGEIAFTETNIPLVIYTSDAIYSKYYGEENAALGTKDQPTTSNNQLIITPNPVDNAFSLNIDEEIRTIDIYDIGGKKIFSASNTKNLDITTLQSGLYFVKVKTDITNYTGKIIKK